MASSLAARPEEKGEKPQVGGTASPQVCAVSAKHPIRLAPATACRILLRRGVHRFVDVVLGWVLACACTGMASDLCATSACSAVRAGATPFATDNRITRTHDTITRTHDLITPLYDMIAPTHNMIAPTRAMITLSHDMITPTCDSIAPTCDMIAPTHDLITPTRDMIAPTHDMIVPPFNLITRSLDFSGVERRERDVRHRTLCVVVIPHSTDLQQLVRPGHSRGPPLPGGARGPPPLWWHPLDRGQQVR